MPLKHLIQRMKFSWKALRFILWWMPLKNEFLKPVCICRANNEKVTTRKEISGHPWLLENAIFNQRKLISPFSIPTLPSILPSSILAYHLLLQRPLRWKFHKARLLIKLFYFTIFLPWVHDVLINKEADLFRTLKWIHNFPAEEPCNMAATNSCFS